MKTEVGDASGVGLVLPSRFSAPKAGPTRPENLSNNGAIITAPGGITALARREPSRVGEIGESRPLLNLAPSGVLMK